MKKNAHRVDVENAEKIIFTIYIDLLAKIGVDRAENEPEVEVWSSSILVLLPLSPADGRAAAAAEARLPVALADAALVRALLPDPEP